MPPRGRSWISFCLWHMIVRAASACFSLPTTTMGSPASCSINQRGRALAVRISCGPSLAEEPVGLAGHTGAQEPFGLPRAEESLPHISTRDTRNHSKIDRWCQETVRTQLIFFSWCPPSLVCFISYPLSSIAEPPEWPVQQSLYRPNISIPKIVFGDRTICHKPWHRWEWFWQNILLRWSLLPWDTSFLRL